ncbi:MAG: hypothetical protein QOE45_1680 [Frankiaceae bacterium]|jgi:hypothetical protein|nr:hypothetical protein [Frankiaceae bacterium]
MSRRLVGSTLVATSLLIGTVAASGATEYPRADCDRRLNDLPGDAVPTFTANGLAPAPVQPSPDSNPGLDVLSVTMNVTADSLEMYLGLKEFPKTFAAQEAGYGYEVMFTKGTKSFRLSHLVPNESVDKSLRPDSILPAYPRAQGGPSSSMALLTSTSVTGELDKTRNLIIIRVLRPEIEKVLGEPLADGDTFTALNAKTFDYYAEPSPTVTNGPTRLSGDTTAGTDDEKTFTVGDAYCLGGPPTTLTDFEAKPVQFGDATEVSVTLANEADEAVEGKEIQFSVAGEPGMPLKATTTDEGIAAVTFTPTKGAGTYPVTVTWAGDDEAGKSKVVGNLVISAEKTKFNALAVAKPSASTRTVTATLLDDDKHAVAGQKVDWYVNGKKVATLATDKAGKSVFKAAKPGQSVQAKLATVTGKYVAANSNTAKV